MKRIVILSFCLLLIMGFAAFAQNTEPIINAGTGNLDSYIAEKDNIGLTSDQVAKLKELQASLGKKNADLIKQRLAMTSQIMLNRLAAAKEADSVLTADQKSKFKTLRAERMEKSKALMKERMEKMKSMKKNPAR